MIDPAIISLLIAALGVIVSIYVAGKKAKTEDISRAVEEAKHGTEVNVKLDMIMKSTDATAKKLDRLQEDMADMKKQNSANMERLKDIEKRVDKLEINLGKLHAEHREHMQNIREEKEIGGV